LRADQGIFGLARRRSCVGVIGSFSLLFEVFESNLARTCQITGGSPCAA
jgi:hypothetical protein